jgi:hypothetical protein
MGVTAPIILHGAWKVKGLSDVLRLLKENKKPHFFIHYKGKPFFLTNHFRHLKASFRQGLLRGDEI